MMNRVAAVVVTYNRCELLMQCLERILHQENASCDILVVDNASTDGTQERVAQLNEPQIRYHNMGKISVVLVGSILECDGRWKLAMIVFG